MKAENNATKSIEHDCEHCIHHTDEGCSSWDYEFEPR